MSEIGDKRECATCHKLVEVMELTPSGDGWYIQNLSCGHTGRIRVMDPIVENVPITERLEREVKRVRTIGDTPILVTDSSGTQLTSGRVEVVTTYQNNVTSGNIYYNSNIHYDIKVTSNSTISNIQNILSMVDSNNTYTQEEKEKVKDTLTKVTDLIQATGSTASKIATFLPLMSNIFPS